MKKKQDENFGRPHFSEDTADFTQWGYEKGQVFNEEDFIPPKKPYHLRLKEARKRVGLNQTEAGQIMLTSQKQYSRWETGQFEVPLFELTLFALWMNLKTDYLLGFSDDESPAFSEEERIERIKALKMSSYFNQNHWFDWWDDKNSKIHNNKPKK